MTYDNWDQFFGREEVKPQYFTSIKSTTLEEIEVVLMEGACVPTRKHEDDAGLDLKVKETVFVPGNTYKVIDTGVCVNIPKGRVGYLKAKSRSNFIVMAGVVDAGYQGTIKVKIYAIDDENFESGDAICQLVIEEVDTPKVKVVEKFTEETERGTSGGINQYKVANLQSPILDIE
jgi:dUTP pyrophosphatase